MDDTTVRLDKYLANAGICSRRNVKALLKAQVVSVNGKRITESGVRIHPKNDEILLDGKKLKKPKLLYFILNKPLGVISTTSDEYGRNDVTSLIPSDERIYPVGRLDKDTSGIILLTNDGELTNLLTHPRYHVAKTYHVTISGNVDQVQLNALRFGVLLDDGITAPAEVKVLKENKDVTLLAVTLHEGKNRQIRRMCETVGLSLLTLKRVRFGPIPLGNLKEGTYRIVTPKEISALRNAAGYKENI